MAKIERFMPKLSARKLVFFIVAAAALALAALAVAIYIDATTFSLKVKVNPKNAGTVWPDKTVRYRGVTPVTLEAEAAYGYVFTGWSGALGASWASDLSVTRLKIILAGDKVLTANFERFEPRSVQIGNRRWMAENLNIIPNRFWCYENRDCIIGKSYCYDNDESNCRKYGRLYDYEASKVACPTGWRLPTKDDWNSLIRAGGYKTGEKLKSKSGWDDWKCEGDRRLWGYDNSRIEKTGCTPGNMYSGNGTDEFGFSALPGGVYYKYYENSFRDAGEIGGWWTDEYNQDHVQYWLSHNSYELENAYCRNGYCGGAASIRCVQDIPGVPEKVVGFDDPPPSIVKSWESGALTVTFYADGLLKVSGNGKMEDCDPPWVEYRIIPSVGDCNSPWRFYPVTGLIIEDGVTHIGSHAFDGCHIMSSVTIPNSVASIGEKAFHYCTSLRSIIIRNPNPPKIDCIRIRRLDEPSATIVGDVFEKHYEKIMEKACLYVPANSIVAYRAADGWKEFGCIKELESAPGGK